MKIRIIKTEPYLLLGIFAIVFLLWGFWVMKLEDAIFFVNIKDLYITMHRGHLYVFLAMVLGFFFGLYSFFQLKQVKLNSGLKKVHIFQTLLAIIGIVFPYSIFEAKENLLNESFDENLILLIFLLLFVLAQIVFIFQVGMILFNKIKIMVNP